MRCTPTVIGALATCFGERPLDIRFWDADEERLDLFDRFARLCFTVTKSPHRLRSITDENEALDGAHLVLFQVGENCARKYLRSSRRQGTATLGGDAMIEQTVEHLASRVAAEALVLNLQRREIEFPISRYYQLEGTLEISPEERGTTPHQILRYLNGEEYLHEYFREHARSAVWRWFEDPASAELVQTGP